MNNIEEIIKNSISLNSRDTLPKLQDYNKKVRKRKKLNKISTLTILLVIITGIIIYPKKEERTILKSNDIINIKELNYLDGSEYGMFEKDLNPVPVDEVLNKYNINISKDTIIESLCDDNQCNLKIAYENKIIYLYLKSNNLSTFLTEPEDNWENNIQDLKPSQINDKKIYIIKNTNDFKYIIDYYQKENINNYRTKFMINNTGVAIETYELTEKEFTTYLHNLLTSNK